MATFDKNFKVQKGIDVATASTFSSDVTIQGRIYAGGSAGTNGQVLTSTGTGIQWSTSSGSSSISIWLYAATGGETILSGTGVDGNTLAYTAGSEMVYVNGVLLVRTQDYTATNGTSITLGSAISSGDYVEVVSIAGNALITEGYAPLASPTFTGTVTLPNTTSIGNVSSTEIGYLDGVSSALQTQIDSKASLSGATFTGAVTGTDLTLSGNLTVNGTTTNINTQNLIVEDKNIIIGDVTTPTNTTADGGGITLKGTTDKTFNWVNATSSWTSSEDLDLASGKVLRINGTQVLSATQYTGNAATVTNGIYTTTTSLPNVTSVNGTTIPSSATLTTSTSTFNLGTTSIALNRASASQSLTGISIDGSAGSVSAANLTGTTLASGVTSSSLTSVGTLTSLTTSGALNLNYASPTIASNNASAASIFTGTVTGITLGSSSILTTMYPAIATTATATAGAGYMGMPQNSTTTGAYRLTIDDSGKHIYSTATRTITIPGNATGGSPQVAFPIGSTIVFANATGTTLTLQMDGTTTDTCLLAGVGTSMTGGSGSRSLAAFGMATLLKITATSWLISGNGLT